MLLYILLILSLVLAILVVAGQIGVETALLVFLVGILVLFLVVPHAYALTHHPKHATYERDMKHLMKTVRHASREAPNG